MKLLSFIIFLTVLISCKKSADHIDTSQNSIVSMAKVDTDSILLHN